MQTTAGDRHHAQRAGRIAYWADNPEQNATALYAYGGDLLGNLWRFDINTRRPEVIRLATFKDGEASLSPSRPGRN